MFIISSFFFRILGSATGPHGHDPSLITRDDDKKALSGRLKEANYSIDM